MKNIFVAGVEPFHLALLENMGGAGDLKFHTLYTYSEGVRPRSAYIEFDALLKIAEKRLYAFGSVDAIVGYWDFPSSALVPLLQRQFGLPGPSLEAVAACQHKYWSRSTQNEVVSDLIPDFVAVDPFAEDPLREIGLSYPFWIKPINSHSSYLGFIIRDEDDFGEALPLIRANISDFGDSFDEFLTYVKVPEHIAHVGGNWCIAEEIISAGKQCTFEGYVYEDAVEIYGVVDSVREGEHRSSFSRYQYPSGFPASVHARMKDAAVRLIRKLDYRNAPFNIEFFWDASADRIWLLEVNARISKSHSPLFRLVDGETNQKVAVDLALGRRPSLPRRRGMHRMAGKFMMRVYEDGIVTRIPRPSDLARVLARYPEAMVRPMVQEGQRLSCLHYQDSYSFEIAEVFLGADSEGELLEKYDAVSRLLPFEFEPIGEEI